LRKQIFHERTVAYHIELEPEGLGRCCCDLIKSTSRDSGERERDARLVCRADRLAFAPPGIETRKANGRQGNGQRQLLAENLSRQIKRRVVTKDPLAKG
jgi:hypothetical protein